ncbi:MAG: 4Fe-4S binding protein [Firmicutes bacterium]|nr:4Fe-4S binding protein [Bacillota bacterium]
MGQIELPLFRVRGMYFSGTGTTEKIVTTVAEGLARAGSRAEDPEAAACSFAKAPDINFTPPAAREQVYRFEPQDIVTFGVPVIAGRVPNVLLPFLNTLEGGGAMAIPVVLYGNRNFDDALIELRDILEAQGFRTVAAAAFIGEHSFSRVLAAGRPDGQDLRIAADFAKAAAAKIEGLAAEAAGQDGGSGQGQPLHEPVEVDGEEPIRPYYRPRDRQGNHINILKVKPKLDAAKCTKCGICVEACPMGSIKPEAPGVVDGICIKCCGCEKKCPEGALYFDDEGYLYHKTELELGYPERKEPNIYL